ncbi:MAG: aminotransferase class I/II-fold pyridoxal phosphate-dependent enzyme [bacterium]|nr:aminotransferase class I/II-fold pyridoxal phosphate-dependent enzyme [bacterium]
MIEIKYHLAEDTIDKADRKAVAEWLLTEPPPNLTMGPLTRRFEEKWSRWLGRPYSVFFNSGSSANLSMAAALATNKRLRNGRVIVPSVGWVTTISPFMQLKSYEDPIMCEADPDTFGLDLNHLEDLLKRYQPSIVMMVQVLGVPHKMTEIMALKDKYGFHLLEDACAAGGSSWHGRNVGTFGNMASFSAYYGHQFSTIEGGLVSTDDKELYEIMLMLRSHGWGKDLPTETYNNLIAHYGINDFNKPFTFFEAGYNLRPTDLQAFIGLRQIDKLEWFIQRRWENHQLYRKLLSGQVAFQRDDGNSVVCSIHFGALARDSEQREKIVVALNAHGIENRMFSAGNLGLHPFWFERYGKFSAPMADRIHHCGFFLPNNPSLNPEDINFISNVVIESIYKD